MKEMKCIGCGCDLPEGVEWRCDACEKALAESQTKSMVPVAQNITEEQVSDRDILNTLLHFGKINLIDIEAVKILLRKKEP